MQHCFGMIVSARNQGQNSMKQRYSLNFTEFLCVGHQPSWSGPPPPGEAETIRSLGVARTKKDKKVMIGDGW
jgi:hypothetical protein